MEGKQKVGEMKRWRMQKVGSEAKSGLWIFVVVWSMWQGPRVRSKG